MTSNHLKGELRKVLHEYTKGKSTERLEEARTVMLTLIEEEIDSYLVRREPTVCCPYIPKAWLQRQLAKQDALGVVEPSYIGPLTPDNFDARLEELQRQAK